MSQSGERLVVFVSLGVGGNQRKRVSPEFERRLVAGLAKGAALIIDSGSTASEVAQVEAISGELASSGVRVMEGAELPVEAPALEETDVLVWRGGIGSFAQLVGASDMYVGYDSAGQHIAAGLERPTLTIFVNTSTPRFADRWRATGRGPTRIVLFEEGKAPDTEVVVGRALSAFEELREEARLLTGS